MKEKIPVFLIDDHELVRESIKDLMEVSGYFKVVDQASNGRTALEKINSLKIRFVILDINLPDINGIKLIPLLHKIRPELEVVMLTMNDNEETKNEAFKYGAAAFFTKNFQRDQFINGLLKLFAGKKKRNVII